MQEEPHEDDSADDAYDEGDVPLDQIDWEAVQYVQSVMDSNPTPIEALKVLYGQQTEIL